MMRPVSTYRLRSAAARWRGGRRRGSAAFAEALIASYRRRDVRRRPLALTALIRRPALLTTIVERHRHVPAAPNRPLRLVVNRLVAPVAASAPLHVGDPVAIHGNRAHSTARAVTRIFVTRHVLPARLIARATRIEVSSPPSTRLTPRSPLAPDTPPLRERRDNAQLPVVRPAAAIAAANTLRPAAPASAPAVTATDNRVGTVTPPRTSAVAVLEQAELQRLASRVISSIDDRIVAARERFGSV